jgi:hypothetical protein
LRIEDGGSRIADWIVDDRRKAGRWWIQRLPIGTGLATESYSDERIADYGRILEQESTIPIRNPIRNPQSSIRNVTIPR